MTFLDLNLLHVTCFKIVVIKFSLSLIWWCNHRTRASLEIYWFLLRYSTSIIKVMNTRFCTMLIWNVWYLLVQFTDLIPDLFQISIHRSWSSQINRAHFWTFLSSYHSFIAILYDPIIVQSIELHLCEFTFLAKLFIKKWLVARVLFTVSFLPTLWSVLAVFKLAFSDVLVFPLRGGLFSLFWVYVGTLLFLVFIRHLEGKITQVF